MFTPDEYYNIVEFTGARTRRDEVVEEIQQQQQRICDQKRRQIWQRSEKLGTITSSDGKLLIPKIPTTAKKPRQRMRIRLERTVTHSKPK